MRLASVPWPGILLAVLIAATLWSAPACAGGNGGRHDAAVQASPGAGITLEVELPHAGLVVLRSPTFR